MTPYLVCTSSSVPDPPVGVNVSGRGSFVTVNIIMVNNRIAV